MFNFYSCTVHFGTIESFIYPTGAQLDCSKKMLKFALKFAWEVHRHVACSSQPSSGSYCMCFGKVIIINNQLKYVVYRIINYLLIINSYNFSKAHIVAPWWWFWKTETCSSTSNVNFNILFEQSSCASVV